MSKINPSFKLLLSGFCHSGETLTHTQTISPLASVAAVVLKSVIDTVSLEHLCRALEMTVGVFPQPIQPHSPLCLLQPEQFTSFSYSPWSKRPQVCSQFHPCACDFCIIEAQHVTETT